MIAARTIWTEISKRAEATRLFADVRVLPLNRAANLEFLDNFPGIRMPACLVVFAGRSRTIRGSGDDRTYRFNLILASADPSGSEALALESIDRLEALEDALCDRAILDGEVVVHGSTEAEAAVTSPRFSLHELAITCRQAEDRVLS